MPLHPLFAEICGAFGMTERDTYRGWEIRRGRWPEPDWLATGPNYDAWTEGEGEWVDNGQRADAPTREALICEIDDWFERNSEQDPPHD